MLFFNPPSDYKLPPAMKDDIEFEVQRYVRDMAEIAPNPWIFWYQTNNYRQRLENEVAHTLEQDIKMARFMKNKYGAY